MIGVAVLPDAGDDADRESAESTIDEPWCHRLDRRRPMSGDRITIADPLVRTSAVSGLEEPPQGPRRRRHIAAKANPRERGVGQGRALPA